METFGCENIVRAVKFGIVVAGIEIDRASTVCRLIICVASLREDKYRIALRGRTLLGGDIVFGFVIERGQLDIIAQE